MISLFSPQDLLHPEISSSVQDFFRIAYGLLLLGTLLLSLPQSKRFFISERWGGYGESLPDVNFIQNPRFYPFVMAFWILSALLLIIGQWTVLAALINLLLCRYFFVYMRWKGVLRGMGAPGFMTYWLSLAVFMLELTAHYAPDVQALALFVLQVDFAFIMLSAGIYKLNAGYPHNEGMELGLVNPQWGYWWQLYARMSPGHWIIRLLNQLAWTTEIAAAILMLFPPTRFIGAMLIIGSFIFIATQIRLGFLCEMVILCGFLYFYPGSLGDQVIHAIIPAQSVVASLSPIASIISPILTILLWVYLILLPLAYGGLFYNFYGHKSLPKVLQIFLERYTNFLGIIIWRVFSVDLVNFYILIYQQPRAGGPRTLISDYGWRGQRYRHVGESITITSVFTTLKYYPSNSERFTERLLRYAWTVPCPQESVLVFEYWSVRKANTHFEYVQIADYVVDLQANRVEEHTLSNVVSVRAAHAVSPVREGVKPGSYVPLEQ